MGRRLHRAGALVFLLLTSSAIYSADQVSAKTACEPWAAKVASVQGQVEAKRHDQTDWQTARLNDIYCPGDQIRVGDNARAAIVLNNETLVRLNQNSAITLSEIKKDGPSFLDLIEGIAHFISRVPRSLKVNTPFVNAAIEGTEFVVAIGNQQTEVTVFEGVVLTKNDYGEVRITQNETSVAKAGSAPQKILKATPRDTVQWALYFPPVFDHATGNLASAQQQLFTGDVTAASNTLKDDSSAEALSLMAIIAVVQNDTDGALMSAQQAVQKNPQLAAAHIALSYAQQAKRNLDSALASAIQATRVDSNNAIAWARVAELQLSTGDLSDARDAAQHATQINPNLARTQTILGFAHLLQIDIDDAKTAFNKAIDLDQVDPLPRLGLGLAKIRQNDLAEGRRDIEIAASLDPNNAIIRSYLGKAYYEEKRAPLDADQFAMAKALDPNDPTPWFYDAIRKQTENDPVGALEDINKSIELNDNRAVYRSSLQLDQDEAVRNVSLANIYRDLGFIQSAISEASNSIATDPSNYSSHEFLANTYLSKSRHEIARVSETLQAKLLNPLNTNPQQPLLTQGTLTFLNNTNTNNTSLYEYGSLFDRNSLNLTLNGLDASQGTESYEAILSGQYQNFAFSAGRYDYNTNGYHPNNGQDLELEHYFLQSRLSNHFSIFAEKTLKNEKLGDRYRFDPANFITSLETVDDIDSTRVGLLTSFNKNNNLILTFLDQDRTFRYFQNFGIGSDYISNTIFNFKTYDVRYLLKNDSSNYTLGYSKTNAKYTESSEFGGFDLGTTDQKGHDNSVYLYSNFNLFHSLDITLGIASESWNTVNFDISNTSPKIGLHYKINPNFGVRLSHFEALRRSFIDDATLEPTQISGFTQLYDDDIGTISTTSAIAFELTNSTKYSIGFEYIYRELDVPSVISSVPTILPMSENTADIYMNYVFTDSFFVNTKIERQKIYRGSFAGNDTYENLLTYSLPVSFNYIFNPSIKTFLTARYIAQEGDFIDANFFTTSYGKDQFWTFDFGLNYIFPKRMGSLYLGVKNIFNEEFMYEEIDRKNPNIAPERTSFINLNLYF